MKKDMKLKIQGDFTQMEKQENICGVQISDGEKRREGEERVRT